VEEVGEDGGWHAGGEVGEGGPACCHGVDAQAVQALAEAVGGDGAAGE
jgi:hypothetical protein